MAGEQNIKTIALTIVIIAIFALTYLFYLKDEGNVSLILLFVGIILSFILGATTLQVRV